MLARCRLSTCMEVILLYTLPRFSFHVWMEGNSSNSSLKGHDLIHVLGCLEVQRNWQLNVKHKQVRVLAEASKQTAKQPQKDIMVADSFGCVPSHKANFTPQNETQKTLLFYKLFSGRNACLQCRTFDKYIVTIVLFWIPGYA